MGRKITEIGIFNSSLEIALRLLIIINLSDKGISRDRLNIYDYLILNTGDIADAPNSLHPALPARSTQLFIKHHKIKEALNILLSKELIIIEPSVKGFLYKKSDITAHVIQYFKSNYYNELILRVLWILDNFNSYTDDQLKSFISKNLEKWGSEFTSESLFRTNYGE